MFAEYSIRRIIYGAAGSLSARNLSIKETSTSVVPPLLAQFSLSSRRFLSTSPRTRFAFPRFSSDPATRGWNFYKRAGSVSPLFPFNKFSPRFSIPRIRWTGRAPRVQIYSEGSLEIERPHGQVVFIGRKVSAEVSTPRPAANEWSEKRGALWSTSWSNSPSQAESRSM